MSESSKYQPLYPETFDATNMAVPASINVEFSFVVRRDLRQIL